MDELERLNVMIPKELKAELTKQANEKGLNLSSYVRLILTTETKKSSKK